MLYEDSQLITIREAASILGVHLETLRRWDNDGKLRAVRIGKTGHRRYPRNVVELLKTNS